METALLIAQLVALVAVTAVCIFLILVLIRVREMLSKIERDISAVTERTMPVLENIDYISSRVKNITDNIDDQVLMVRESMGSIREIADNIVALERQVQSRIEGPILDTVALIAALVKGVKAFTSRLRA
ncbi:MAG: DUF948 domain-containing protein [Bacteroidetes bacterium]|nr:DUF948 domain-containing protein [Bacteroidota bacterium]MCW5895171.1 DUF948 domain-containing protein [Bacteroidota bacterium]